MPNDSEGFKKVYWSAFFTYLMSKTKQPKGMTQTLSTQNIKKILDYSNISFEEKKARKIRYLKFKYESKDEGSTFDF